MATIIKNGVEYSFGSDILYRMMGSEDLTLIAEAITEKGVDTSSDATVEEMAENIRSIQNECKHFLRSTKAGVTQTFDCEFAPYAIFVNSIGTENVAYPYSGIYIGETSGTMLVSTTRGGDYDEEVKVTISGNTVKIVMPSSSNAFVTSTGKDNVNVTVMSKDFYDSKSS